MKFGYSYGLMASLLLANAAHAAVVTISAPVADAFVASGPAGDLTGIADKNYGGAGTNIVAGTGGGKGEFKSLMQFDTSGVKSSFDTTYGAGNWTITSITITNASNVGTNGASPGNAIFPNVAQGNFNISWIQADNWQEGTGSPNSGTTDGVTYNTLSNFTATMHGLGTFNWNTPGNNIQKIWSLGLDASLVTDVGSGSGSLISFLYTPVDSGVAFLFNSKSFGTVANRPILTITAVPEPGILAVLGLSLFGLMARRRI